MTKLLDGKAAGMAGDFDETGHGLYQCPRCDALFYDKKLTMGTHDKSQDCFKGTVQ